MAWWLHGWTSLEVTHNPQMEFDGEKNDDWHVRYSESFPSSVSDPKLHMATSWPWETHDWTVWMNFLQIALQIAKFQGSRGSCNLDQTSLFGWKFEAGAPWQAVTAAEHVGEPSGAGSSTDRRMSGWRPFTSSPALPGCGWKLAGNAWESPRNSLLVPEPRNGHGRLSRLTALHVDHVGRKDMHDAEECDKELKCTQVRGRTGMHEKS